MRVAGLSVMRKVFVEVQNSPCLFASKSIAKMWLGFAEVMQLAILEEKIFLK
jgi:hypothetical protein